MLQEMLISVIICFMKKIICIFLCLILTVLTCSCSAQRSSTEKFSSSFLDLFDTASTVIAYDSSKESFDENLKKFHDMLEEYDHLYSIYDSYDGVTNLYQVNKRAAKEPIKVDSRIIDLLEYGKEVYNLSGGKTNICFGAVLSIWHKYRTVATDNPDEAQLPPMDELKEAAKHTNIDDLVIDAENNTVFFKDPEMKLDVGAIAKGYAVEQVGEWSKGLWGSAALSIGGNIFTYGYKSNDGKTLWNIGIENPDKSVDDYVCSVRITELSVVVSGDYQRYYTVDGKKYCHIINPDTLMPAEYFSGVSVICDNSALGDALSTTLFNMPLDEGKRLVEGMDGVEALWIDKSYNKTFSSGFESYIDK